MSVGGLYVEGCPLSMMGTGSAELVPPFRIGPSHSLPLPRQVTGRGRGSNAWVSPPGSLSVSVHRRFSGIPAYTVFLQYAAGLAVVQAVRGEVFTG